MASSLDKSLFFKLLLSKFGDVYQEACDKRWLICIPPVSSTTKLSKDVILYHILKPSLLLKDHYIPCSKGDINHVEVDSNQLIITRNSSHIKDKIQIVKHETAYNSRNEKFSILLIDKIFGRLMDQDEEQSTDSSNLDKQLNIKTLEDCVNYLQSLSAPITEVIKSKALGLISTYILLPNYLEDAAQRFKSIIDSGIERFYQEIDCEIIDPDSLNISVESLVIGAIHDKVFKVFLKKYSYEDEMLYAKFQQLDDLNLTLQDLGAQPVFRSFKLDDQIIAQLTTFESASTPLDKLFCLKSVQDLIHSSLSQIIISNRTPFEKVSNHVIVSDDIISATIYIIYKFKPKHLFSNIKYIYTFGWYLPSKNEFGYSLTTFEAAMMHIKDKSISFPPSSSSSSFSLPSSTNSNTNHNPDGQNNDHSKITKASLSRSSSSIDDDLENITQMIKEIKYSDLTESNDKINKDQKLGSFLSSLRKNHCLVGSGRQS